MTRSRSRKSSTDGHGGYSIKIAVPEPQYGVNV